VIEIAPQQLLLEAGAGVVLGAVVGYVCKRFVKTLAVLVGLQLVAFRFLESRGVVAVDYERLTAGVVRTGREATAGSPPLATTLLSTLAVSTGFAVGFLVGYGEG